MKNIKKVGKDKSKKLSIFERVSAKVTKALRSSAAFLIAISTIIIWLI